MRDVPPYSAHLPLAHRIVPPASVRLEGMILAVATFLPAARPLLAPDGLIPLSTRLVAAALWVLCLAPAWIYLAKPAPLRRPVPLLPLIGLLYGLYYALPALLGAEQLYIGVWIDPAQDYGPAIGVALAGWLAVLAGYAALSLAGRPWRGFELTTPSDAAARAWAVRLLAAGLAVRVALAVVPAAQVLGGTAGFVSSLATFGLAFLIMEWRLGGLALKQKVLVVVAASGLGLISIGTGAVADILILVAMLGLAYWAARPEQFGIAAWVALIVCVGFALAVKGTTKEFRELAWGESAELGIAERAGLTARLLSARVASEGIVGAVMAGGDAAASRSSNADLLAEVVRRTPAEVPFWNGETYLSLAGALVPRVLWPDKPVKNLGQEFGHRYGYLDATDRSTSINFPWLVEAFANFGSLGVVLVCLCIGAVYALLGHVVNVPGQSLWTTAAGIVAIMPLLNIESDLSLTFGGIPLVLAALWVVLRWIARREHYRPG